MAGAVKVVGDGPAGGAELVVRIIRQPAGVTHLLFIGTLHQPGRPMRPGGECAGRIPQGVDPL